MYTFDFKNDVLEKVYMIITSLMLIGYIEDNDD